MAVFETEELVLCILVFIPLDLRAQLSLHRVNKCFHKSLLKFLANFNTTFKIAFVGKENSGRTTLITKIISEYELPYKRLKEAKVEEYYQANAAKFEQMFAEKTLVCNQYGNSHASQVVQLEAYEKICKGVLDHTKQEVKEGVTMETKRILFSTHYLQNPFYSTCLMDVGPYHKWVKRFLVHGCYNYEVLTADMACLVCNRDYAYEAAIAPMTNVKPRSFPIVILYNAHSTITAKSHYEKMCDSVKNLRAKFDHLYVIPVSALLGSNIVMPDPVHFPWYKGLTFREVVLKHSTSMPLNNSATKVTATSNNIPVVAKVLKIHTRSKVENGFIMEVELIFGKLKVGQVVQLEPFSHCRSRIVEIQFNGLSISHANQGTFIGIHAEFIPTPESKPLFPLSKKRDTHVFSYNDPSESIVKGKLGSRKQIRKIHASLSWISVQTAVPGKSQFHMLCATGKATLKLVSSAVLASHGQHMELEVLFPHLHNFLLVPDSESPCPELHKFVIHASHGIIAHGIVKKVEY